MKPRVLNAADFFLASQAAATFDQVKQGAKSTLKTVSNMPAIAMRPYGRVDPCLQAEEERKRMRKRWFIITITTTMVVVLTLGVGFGVSGGSKSGGDTSNPSSQSLDGPCSATSYQQTCVHSLGSIDIGGGKPNNVLEAAVLIALARFKQMFGLTRDLIQPSNNLALKTALSDCKSNLDLALDRLNISHSQLLSLNGQMTDALFNDLKTWVSSSLTYLTTCIDGLIKAEGISADQLRAHGQYNKEILSNALALLQFFHNKMAKPIGRRLLSDFTDDGFPKWLSPTQRQLLQDTSPPQPDVIVAQDGSGNFTKIQDALDAMPEGSSSYVVYIKEGVYWENVMVTKKMVGVVMVGEATWKTIISGYGNALTPGKTTFNSATAQIEGQNFVARDLTIRNVAGPANYQAVALRVSADLAAFYRCSIQGFQDTLYAHTDRQFYRECIISGSVDFIFGNAAALFQNTTLIARPGLPGQQYTYTAQGRLDKNQNTGFSFHQCNLLGTPDLMNSSIPQAFLGRPWKPYSRTVFMKCYLSSVLDPAGWLEWNNSTAELPTLFYGEFGNYGPGSDSTHRVSWSTAMTWAQTADFTVPSFIQGDNWLPVTHIPFQSDL